MRRKHRFIVVWILSLLAWAGGSAAFAAAGEDWDISEEIRRLYKEAPSMSAYPDVRGVVWLRAARYTLAPDGAMEKSSRSLMLMGQRRPGGERERRVFPIPQSGGASLAVTEASWYNPMTGMKEGALPVEEAEAGGLPCVVVEYPDETEGRVIAIETRERYPEKPYLDDLVPLAGAYPIWEQSVTVDIPDGMDLYWQGEGVREPIRHKSGGREAITWTLMNQPVWRGAGIVEGKRPSVAFSLRRGPASSLRALQEEAARFQAPPPPSALAIADRGDLLKAGESVAAYIAKRSLPYPADAPEQETLRNPLPPDGPWTRWEQTLIAGAWLRSMGHASDLYWNQRFPVPEDGPNTAALWSEPALLFRARGERGGEVVFTAGQSAEFGRTAPALCGKTLFRMTGGVAERFDVPAGSAAEHTLAQSWRLSLDERGMATGTLEITVTGGWTEALAYGRLPEAETLAETLRTRFLFNAPGLTFSSPSVTPLAGGYRVAFAVGSALGIVSGSDILMRVPSAAPQCLEEIAPAGERYALRFPFTLEQSVKIATPRGYRTVGVLPAEKMGDSKAALEVSMLHWPKRGELEVSGRWIVRAREMDETLSRVMQGQLSSYVRWSQTTLPLRKR